ncbi:monovalent cation/H+ antiporter subunit D [Phreatobacter sp.]|uniref:monovalent cation/H+ antiporter subunit D n=1 Tax=Phreatobacter sp. TaxID=1966341 RepID=UPI003F6FEF8C
MPMSGHMPILPFVVPFSAAFLLMIFGRTDLALRRALALGATVLTLVSAIGLVMVAGDGAIHVYRLGNWPAPYGIVLVADRLSAIMVALTAVLALPVLLAAISTGMDGRGHFHALLQLQFAGLMGAFLTGDLFNLFVCFEILLLASYTMLVHGGGPERSRAGLAYVILNLTGSSLFLIALGLIYGTLGTLNLADLAEVLPRVAPADQALARTALALLIAVFLLKAAVLPLSFWLPNVYPAATAPIAALFAVMTKVGIYAILRVSSGGLDAAPFTADLLKPWLPALGAATIAVGAIGALAARRFGVLVANLVLVSTGTLIVAVATGGPEPVAAALFYLPHTTLATAGLFLLGAAIAGERGTLADTIEKGPLLADRVVPGAAFLTLGIAVCGAPPLSGFLGKLMLMQSVSTGPIAPWYWAALLITGLVVALVLSRAASAFFWEPTRPLVAEEAGEVPPRRAPAAMVAAIAMLAAAGPLLTIFAAPVSAYMRAAAAQLEQRQSYGNAVVGAPVQRERRP